MWTDSQHDCEKGEEAKEKKFKEENVHLDGGTVLQNITTNVKTPLCGLLRVEYGALGRVIRELTGWAEADECVDQNMIKWWDQKKMSIGESCDSKVVWAPHTGNVTYVTV